MNCATNGHTFNSSAVCVFCFRTATTPEEKLSAKLAEYQALMDGHGEAIQQIKDMVAGVIPCAQIRLTETQCIACEGVPSRKCPDCGDPLCEDCRPDHNHGSDWQ